MTGTSESGTGIGGFERVHIPGILGVSRWQNGGGEEGREWRFPGLLYAYDLGSGGTFFFRCVGKEV